jgi:hypothetical protein
MAISEQSDEVQSYIIELLLTLIINAELIAKQYSKLLTISSTNSSSKSTSGSIPAAFLYTNRDLTKAKSATLSQN